MSNGGLVHAVYPSSAVDQFVALMASSNPRCGAGSPARALCSSPPLAAILWRTVVTATRSDFVVVVSGLVATMWLSHTISFSVCGSLLSLVGGACSATSGDSEAVQWVTPRVGVRRESQGFVERFVFLKEMRRPPPHYQVVRQSDVLSSGFKNDAANSKWFITAEFAGAITISRIEGWPDSRKSFDPVMVTIPGCESIVSFNHGVDDEALLRFHIRPTQCVELILFDVNLTHKSGNLAVITSVSLKNMDYTFDDVRVMRRRSGAVVFVATSLSSSEMEVVLIDPTATEVMTRVTCNCAVISQVSSSVFCAWCPPPTRSFELWDCNDLSKPLRAINSGDNFTQVVGGQGFLFGVVGGKVVVMEAFTGTTVVTFDVSLALPTATQFIVMNPLSLLE
ncbi:hypothetical protein Pelo_5139 [Pelomyxa schiedti]|nr:hypothetical protein Pelo_5139 [Pelomyxa schiedti]